ncbi:MULTISPECIES: hypothetical protein [Marinobacter]|uniref:hypothetical protein n=1 Tax=Marinobacter TaxID=2742 RepID=UPI0003617132|nr:MULTISPECIES: hypothetical protein [Marinobacter]PFG11570.1 hypothetical protein ATI45_4101 [Marinobacter sp. LV10MA510-1]
MSNKLIRNSTAEFLIFTGQAGEQSIEARREDQSIWLNQELLAKIFCAGIRTVATILDYSYRGQRF